MITVSNTLAYQLTIVLHVFLLVGIRVRYMEEHQQKYHMLLYLYQYVVEGVKLTYTQSALNQMSHVVVGVYNGSRP